MSTHSNNKLACKVAFNACYTIMSSMELMSQQIKYEPMFQFHAGYYQSQAQYWILNLENAIAMFKNVGNCAHLLEQTDALIKDVARLTFNDYKLILETMLKVDSLLKSIQKFQENLPILEQAYLQ